MLWRTFRLQDFFIIPFENTVPMSLCSSYSYPSGRLFKLRVPQVCFFAPLLSVSMISSIHVVLSIMCIQINLIHSWIYSVTIYWEPVNGSGFGERMEDTWWVKTLCLHSWSLSSRRGNGNTNNHFNWRSIIKEQYTVLLEIGILPQEVMFNLNPKDWEKCNGLRRKVKEY